MSGCWGEDVGGLGIYRGILSGVRGGKVEVLHHDLLRRGRATFETVDFSLEQYRECSLVRSWISTHHVACPPSESRGHRARTAQRLDQVAPSTRASTLRLSLLIPRRTRRLLILPQARQKFPKPLLPRPARPTPRALPAQIHQFGNSFPARTAGRGVFATGEKLFGFFAGLGDGLVFFLVVVFVEVVNGRLGGFDRFGFFGGGDFGAAGEVLVAAFAPLSVGGERGELEGRGGGTGGGGNLMGSGSSSSAPYPLYDDFDWLGRYGSPDPVMVPPGAMCCQTSILISTVRSSSLRA